MRHSILQLACTLCLCAATARAADGAAPAADSAPAGGPRVLMLGNGELIEGVIARRGDRYDVRLKDGELHIRVSEVTVVCASRRECYEKRREGIDLAKAGDRLALAEWCIRQKLYDEAASELEAARGIDPAHPKTSLVVRRLELVSRQPAPKAPAAARPAPAISPGELDRMLKGLPAGSVERFTSSIQPLLLNGCSTAACHGTQSHSSLKLLRLPVGRSQSRRSTQRNLHAVLGAINTLDVEASPLLTAPVRPHGTAKKAVFTSREAEQFKLLSDWVRQVSGVGPEIEEHADGDDPAVVSADPHTETKTPVPTADDEPAPLRQPSSVRPLSAPRRPPRAPAKRAEPLRGFVPQDEFDPEIFNRAGKE